MTGRFVLDWFSADMIAEDLPESNTPVISPKSVMIPINQLNFHRRVSS